MRRVALCAHVTSNLSESCRIDDDDEGIMGKFYHKNAIFYFNKYEVQLADCEKDFPIRCLCNSAAATVVPSLFA